MKRSLPGSVMFVASGDDWDLDWPVDFIKIGADLFFDGIDGKGLQN